MLDPGTLIDGRYRIVRLLGEGGMGAVYEAEHAVVFRRVAIKILHPHYAKKPEVVRRFEREARVAAEIGHENIVAVLDAGMHDEAPFLVMELLQGETLGARLERVGRFASGVAVKIIGRVLSALAATHAVGVVHRDLKPENVFLLDGPEGESVVKLLDFGVSKFQRADEIQLTTQEGIVLGTPAYMAPEQWMGRRDIDARADLFAAGAMLHEMLTGSLPFSGSSQGELFLEVVRGSRAPLPPSTKVKELDPGLDAVILRALERDRELRFASAQEFLLALAPYGAEGIEATSEAPRPSADDTSQVRPVLRVSAPTLMESRWSMRRTGFAALVVVSLLVSVSALMRSSVRVSQAAVTPAVHEVAAREMPVQTAALVPPVVAEPEAPQVRVEMQGLPERATWRLDGAPGEGAVVTVPRDGGGHELVVLAGRTRETVRFTADRDQIIVLRLAPSGRVGHAARGEALGHRHGRTAAPLGITATRQF